MTINRASLCHGIQSIRMMISHPKARIILIVMGLLSLLALRLYCPFTHRSNRVFKIEKKETPSGGPVSKADGTARNILQTSGQIDPITNMEFEEGEERIVIDNVQFSANSLARYMLTNNCDHTFKRLDHTQITIWTSSATYLAILQQLQLKVKDPELLQGLKLRQDGYLPAKNLIDEFDQQHPDFSFSNLLECLDQKMALSSSQGASMMGTYQERGFEAYFKLRNCLPENIVKIIFPFYAYAPGDPNCISSASRVLKGQKERLILLDLNKRCTISPQEASERCIDSYIHWFEKKFEPLVSPAVQENHWADQVISVKTYQIGFNRDGAFRIPVTLRYVPLKDEPVDAFDHFAIALIEKFRKNSASFSQVQHQISDVLKGQLPESEKKKAIRDSLQQLRSGQSDLTLLKQLCQDNRDIFRSIRHELKATTDATVWEKIEGDAGLIKKYFDENQRQCISMVIKQKLGIEIPLSGLQLGSNDKELFRGEGAFPQIMFSERDQQFNLLLSAE